MKEQTHEKVSDTSRFVLIFALLLYIPTKEILAQDTGQKFITKSELEEVVNKMADSLAYYYIDIDEGIRIGNHIISRLKQGAYNTTKDFFELADQLTKDLRSVNGDLHLSVSYHDNSTESNQNSTPSDADKYGPDSNYGFQKISFIEGNIAYLKVNHFSNWTFANRARQKISQIMTLFKDSKAFIIDVRDNPGGVPYIASYFASYFFSEEPIHLAQYYTRFNNFEYGIYTEQFAVGKKYPDIPVFILVNKNSASAAEELPFWLQNHKRAVIIGERTAGAGYGAMSHDLGFGFSVSISSSVEVDPITKKGFQITGVTPDIATEDSASLSIALDLAKKAMQKNHPTDSTGLHNFIQLLKSDSFSKTRIDLYNTVISLHNDGLLNFAEINNLGYEYINEPQKAIPILKANTILYPFYPNPFDSYADALVNAELYQVALLNYRKAVKLAEIKNNPNLQLFRSNMNNFISKYGSHLNND